MQAQGSGAQTKPIGLAGVFLALRKPVVTNLNSAAKSVPLQRCGAGLVRVA